jgi:DNA-binding beta-propeller fold protein YncE
MDPAGVAISPNGYFLYIANANTTGTNGISAYLVTSSNPTAIALDSLTTGNYPTEIAITPNGRFLYVTNNWTTTGANGLSGFSITSSTGALTPITSGTLTTGKYPFGIAISPDGNFLYVANQDNNTANGLSAYSINASTGALTAITSGTLQTGPNPQEVAIVAK